MATYTINTAQAIDTLVDTGIEPNQAKAIVQVFGETQEALATKNDVQSLVSRVDSLESKMDSKFDALESKLQSTDSKFDALESKLQSTDSKINALESRMDSKFDAFESRMDSKFDAFETTIMAEIKASLFQTKAILMGFQLGIAALLVAVLAYLN